MLRQGPGRILEGIDHHQQSPGARVGLARQGHEGISQAGVGSPQAQHHLGRRRWLGQAGGPPQPPPHHQREGKREQQLQAEGGQQGAG